MNHFNGNIMPHSSCLGLTIMFDPSLVGSATPALGPGIKHGCHTQGTWIWQTMSDPNKQQANRG